MSAIENADKYSAKRRIIKRRRLLALCLSIAVAFGTCYSLMLPAATLERDCGLDEHTHSGECYAQAQSEIERVLVCDYETLGVHEHSDECYDDDGELSCGLADFVLHTHSDSCYDDDGELVCSLPETQRHRHTRRCYDMAKAHEHTDKCFEERLGELICELPEDDGHTHLDECYVSEFELVCDLDEDEFGEPELACGKDELSEHTHDFYCYDDDGELICGMLELSEHTHSRSCFITIETPSSEEGEWELICGLEEHTHSEGCVPADESGEGEYIGDADCFCGLFAHTHDYWCFDELGNLICGEAEHIHTDECLVYIPDDEALAALEHVNSLIAELPDYDELSEILAELEYIGDEDGYNDYIIEISRLSREAYDAYCQLPEELQQLVVGVDKLAALEPLYVGTTLEIISTYDVYQISNYKEAYNTLVYGGSASDKNLGMSFKYWKAIIVEKDSSGLYVSSVDKSTNAKGSLKASTSDGFVLFTQQNVTVEPGCRVFVDFNYKTAKAYNGSPYGTISFDSGTEPATKPEKNNSVDEVYDVEDTADLIELNLFNYGENINDLHDTVSVEYPGFQQDNGTTTTPSSINRYSLNFGNNITVDLAAGNSGITKGGGAINQLNSKGIDYPISGAMNSHLVNGYPALKSGQSLEYLFTDNQYAEQLNTESINYLFQRDKTTGAYYYNSRQNHAQYNYDNTFTLYKQTVTSNFMMYPFGNFLPFNDIKTQCAQTSQIDRSYITAIKNSAQLKSEQYTAAQNSAAYGKLATSLDNFIGLMNNSYSSGWTAADCINEYFSAAELGNSFTQSGPRLGQLYSIDFDEPTDFYFGMEMVMEFNQPRGGYTGPDGKQPMVFDFAGDDDVWVYVDGVLFLDLSGIHRHVGGTIDFVNGVVQYYALDPGTGDISTTPYETVPFSDIVDDPTQLNANGTFKDYTRHKFQFYYMERGAGSGVCRLEFNFPLLRKNSISVSKELSTDTDGGEALLGNPDFSFQVIRSDGNGLFIQPNTEYTLYDSAGNILKTGLTTDENGVFTIKEDQTAVFSNILENSGSYFVRELLDREFFEQYGQIIVDGEEKTIDYDVTVGTDYFHGVDSPVKDMSSGSTVFTFNNRVSIDKLGELSITKNVIEFSNAEPPAGYDFKITLGGEPLPAGTAYTVDGETRYSKAGGIITLLQDETAVISGILAGTTFTVEETTASAEGYIVTYFLDGVEQEDAANGTIGISSSAAVRILNTEKGAAVELPVEKTLLMPDGREHTYSFTLERVESPENPTPTDPTYAKKLQISITNSPVSESFIIDYPQHELEALPQTFFYRITEDKTPQSGTIFDDAVYIAEITVDSSGEGAVASISRLWKNGEAIEVSQVLAFTNTLARYELPEAGGPGSGIYMFAGASLLLCALLGLILLKSRTGESLFRRRAKIYKDEIIIEGRINKMKLAKKNLCLVLALIFALALMIPASASGDKLSDTCTVNFEGYDLYSIALLDDDPTPTQSFNGYQLLSLNVSLKCSHTAEETHTADCYNYAYDFDTLGTGGASKYRAILMTAAGLTDSYSSDILARDALLAALGDMDDDEIRDFADAVYRAIKAAGLAADASTTYPSLSVNQGYWLFADVTVFGAGEKDTVKSLVLLDTAGNPTVSVTPKKDAPKVEKKISDNAESIESDSTDVSVGDKVYFEITGTLPSYIDSYVEYKYVFHDTLSAGLTLDTTSIKVTIDGTEVTPDIKSISGGSIEIGFNDLISFSGSTVSSSSKIVLTYSATLNENAVIGGSGNTNTVYLEYTNDPYNESTGSTKDDVVTAYSFQLDVIKKDETSNKLLEGAQFKLKNAAGKWATVNASGVITGWADDEADASVFTSDEDGKFSVIGLDQGTYYLKEIVAPVGYNLPNDLIKLVIAATYDDTKDPPALKTLTLAVDDGDAEAGNISTGTVETTVFNNTGAQLPETGGVGTTLFYVIGSVLVLGAAVLLITRKRMGRN